MINSSDRRPPSDDPTKPVATPRLMVLHVDDEAINRRVMQELLRALGHVGFQAESGPRALELARLAAFDLILMDIHMPGMTGIHAVQSLKSSTGPVRAIPVVAVSADVVSFSLRDCRGFGFCGLLAKPVSLRALSDEIEQAWANGPRRHDQHNAGHDREAIAWLGPLGVYPRAWN